MNYTLGQTLRWVPTYFKWDVAANVIVERIYNNGHALLSNNKIADEDGHVRWFGKDAGFVNR